MRPRPFAGIAALALLLILVPASSSAQAQYVVPISTFSNGAALVTSGNHNLVGTIGQPAIGITSNGTYKALIGFVYNSGSLITSVEQESDVIPTEFRLEQNFPNPFNPATTIRFALPKVSTVTLKLYDMLGREVATLVDEELQPGVHKVVFEAGDLPTGVYLCRIQAQGFVANKKIMLVK